MRILVISDSHSATSNITKALETEKEANFVFFLGDVLGDIEDYPLLYPQKRFYFVRGNCDFYSTEKATDYEILCDKKIMFTHGHNYSVKGGLSVLIENAKKEKADIVLFGHTHNPITYYENGVHFVNPGAMKDGSYAVIDIEKSGILTTIKKV